MEYYVRERLKKWDGAFETIASSRKVNVKSESIGYLEVFDSIEAFDKAYPLEKPLIFESVEDDEM